MSSGRRRLEPTLPRWLPWLLVVSVVALAGVGWLLGRGAANTETENADLTNQAQVLADQRDATAEQALQAVSPVVELCDDHQSPGGEALRTDPRDPCGLAARVQADPVAGPEGPQGRPGAEGRGITGTSIRDGHLFVTFTDGITSDLGVVAGVAGADGQPGRGITGSLLENGRLVLAFSDGATQDVGPVVGANGTNGADGRNGTNGMDGAAGADGRGVASVDEANGRLVVTYTDDATQDVGPLPAGPAGPSCPLGSSLQTVTYGDDRVGLGCVLADQPVESEPTTTVPDDGGTGG